jgi:hypothetical protein
MKSTADVLQFPQRLLGLVLALITGEFAHNGGLCHLLLSQGGQDALEVGPFPFDQLHIHLVRRFQETLRVLVRRLEPHQRVHLLVNVAIPGSETVPEDMQQKEVDLVGPVGVSRVALGPDVGGVIVKQIEDEVALMLMGTDHPGIDGDMIGHDGTTDDPCAQTEVLGGMAGVEGVNLGFQPLAITAGVERPVDIVERKHRQPGGCITDEIIGLMQGFGT